MRRVELTADQFDNFVFEPVARHPVSDSHQKETAKRLMKKLMDLTEPADPKKPYTVRALVGETCCLKLEQDEWDLLLARVKAHEPNVATIGLEMYDETVDVIKKASLTED